MTRISLIIHVFICICMFVGAVNAQGATIKGEVIDASHEQIPIVDASVKIVNAVNGKEHTVTTDINGFYEKKGLPAGRYTISVYKRGYGDRIGRSKVVAAGGETFDRIKMRKQENIFTYLFDIYGFFILGVIIAFILIFTEAEL